MSEFILTPNGLEELTKETILASGEDSNTPKPSLTKDDYLEIRQDLIAKHFALGKLIESLNHAIWIGCFRDIPQTATEGPQAHAGGNAGDDKEPPKP